MDAHARTTGHRTRRWIELETIYTLSPKGVNITPGFLELPNDGSEFYI